MDYYLAVDIGASSGRHILSYVEEGRIITKEIYRFANGALQRGGSLIWDVDYLFTEIKNGMRKCSELGMIPKTMGIDTWGVDYVLLDKDDNRIGDCISYRDTRTEGMDAEVLRIISEDELYSRTGIQKAIFNTIYQLMAMKKSSPSELQKACTFLMVPDYLNFLLTGIKKQEYTNATTTQLVDAGKKDWDHELIKRLGLPDKLFGALSMPGTEVGELTEDIAKSVGFSCKVILPATHDTGSAVMSIPSIHENVLFISSGTWSLMGCELSAPNCSKEARMANFTNEGGYNGRYRFLKNIMGLWMIQSVKKELEEGYDYPGKSPEDDFSFANLCKRAEREQIESVVDAKDSRFLNPRSMIKEIREACREKNMDVPSSPWELAKVIYKSLAVCYRDTAKEIEQITGRNFDCINIVGGGSNADFLNKLTAHITGKKVFAGPGEATAIGNIGAQLLYDNVFSDLGEFRKAVLISFEIKED